MKRNLGNSSMLEIELNVIKLLEANEPLRNSDNALLMAYWIVYNNLNPKGFKSDCYVDFVKGLTSAGSIIRARAKIQGRGDFQPTDPDVLYYREAHRKEIEGGWLKERIVTTADAKVIINE